MSPNSYFAFTPLLAGASVGTVDFNSCVEPVRRYGSDVTYYQAWADKVDFKNKRITAMPATGSALRKRLNAQTTDESNEALKPATSFPGYKPFTLTYDKLVIAVGCALEPFQEGVRPNDADALLANPPQIPPSLAPVSPLPRHRCYSATFGIPGVSAHAYFLKDVRDAAKIRARILECFELACQPTVTDEERRNLLNFVIVGGGPTGASALHARLGRLSHRRSSLASRLDRRRIRRRAARLPHL